MTFDVQLGDRAFGELTLPTSGAPSFVANSDAAGEDVAAFDVLVTTASESDSVEYSWSKRTLTGETYMCARSVATDNPRYPAALAHHLQGVRLAGGIVTLRRR